MAGEMKLSTWRKQTCSRSINSVLSCSIIILTTILINCAVTLSTISSILLLEPVLTLEKSKVVD